MGLRRFMMGCWHTRQRTIDVEVLWPVICSNARDLEHARKAFAWHALRDSAWTVLGSEGVHKAISELPDLTRNRAA